MNRFFRYLRRSRFISSPAWFVGFLVAVLLALVVFGLNSLMSEVRPGSAWGLTYGWIAASLMVGAALYGMRRRMLAVNLGRSQMWVQFHVYGGALFMLLVLMHSAFKVPSGQLAWWLWALSLWVTISGIVGVLLQKWIPRLLASGLAVEVVYERIPELVNQIRAKAEELLDSCTDAVRDFYSKSVAPSLVAPQPRIMYYFDITGGIHSRIKEFRYIGQFLSGQDKKALDELESMYKTKLELDAHYTLQKALRWWLYLHVPVSIVLVLLLVLHVYAVVFY